MHKSLLEIEENCTEKELHEYSSGCVFNQQAKETMQKIKNIFSVAKDYGYPPIDWYEALGFIHFIKKYRCNNESDEKVIA